MCDEVLVGYGINIEWRHVKAHQDAPKNRKQTPKVIIPLNQVDLLNIDCDNRAEDMYTTPSQDCLPHHNPIIPKEMKVWFVSNGITNTAKLQSQIVQDRHTPALKKHIMQTQNRTMISLTPWTGPHMDGRFSVKQTYSEFAQLHSFTTGFPQISTSIS